MVWKKRNDFGYDSFRETVLKRDKRKCQMPSCNSKKHVQVHHILEYSKYSSLRTNPDFSISLCAKCHKSIKGKERFYVQLFSDIIARNKQ